MHSTCLHLHWGEDARLPPLKPPPTSWLKKGERQARCGGGGTLHDFLTSQCKQRPTLRCQRSPTHGSERQKMWKVAHHQQCQWRWGEGVQCVHPAWQDPEADAPTTGRITLQAAELKPPWRSKATLLQGCMISWLTQWLEGKPEEEESGAQELLAKPPGSLRSLLAAGLEVEEKKEGRGARWARAAATCFVNLFQNLIHVDKVCINFFFSV